MKKKDIKKHIKYLLNTTNRHEAVLQEIRKELNTYAEPIIKQSYNHDVTIAINEVIENFDFVRVHKAMTALNWEWYGIGVPTEQQLKDKARSLLIEMMNQDREIKHLSTGGFACDYKDGTISLKFVVYDYDVDIYVDYRD